MATKEQIQDLLRFLSKDAKLPLAVAMSKVKPLQEASIATPEAIARESVTKIIPIFGDEKAAKAVLAAAKRVSKKRAMPVDGDASTSPKRARPTVSMMRPTPRSIEASLALPTARAPEATLAATVLHTNRAPLVLAFAVKVLEHTHPTQPLSSRLSLAEAVVSANSRSKAVSIGIEHGPSAEDQGWGQGQPRIKVLGRDIRTLKRYDYDPTQGDEDEADNNDNTNGNGNEHTASGAEDATQSTLQADDDDDHHHHRPGHHEPARELPLWGLDLEAMRDKQPRGAAPSADLPVFRPEAARAYLVKAFASAPQDGAAPSASPMKKPAAALAAEKEANCALLLQAIDLLLASWADTLGREELDRRAWTWYCRVRPDVADGVAGWGGKNAVRLQDILDLRRKVDDG